MWDSDGREYLDTVMALGAVGLGYGHPHVVEAVTRAARDGAVGPLAPVIEERLAERLVAILPGSAWVRFLKSGAEAVQAAVRIARVATGRDRVITCGYHGWLDWCQDTDGVPEAVRALRREVPFNDVTAVGRALDEFGPVACVVVEPVVDAAASREWLETLRDTTRAQDTLLVFDEIKTAFRVAVGGVAEESGVEPDLMVVGKALGNGYPIAAVSGSATLAECVTRTWISSTLATEYVSLAAADAVLDVYEHDDVIGHLATAGARLRDALRSPVTRYPGLANGVAGIPQMCYPAFVNERVSGEVARAAARRGLLFKRDAYNFVSLAHTDEVIDEIAGILHAAFAEVAAC